jgi:hypothetical protein
VIRMLRGEPLPGSAKYYIHNWDAPLPDAVTKLGAYTRGVLEGKSVMQGPLTATSVPPSYIEQSVSMRNVVPRDRTAHHHPRNLVEISHSGHWRKIR